jgi:hypothetical protein
VSAAWRDVWAKRRVGGSATGRDVWAKRRVGGSAIGGDLSDEPRTAVKR